MGHKLLFIAAILLIGVGPASGQVRISEFMASNSATLADEDGAFSDWIEVHNAGPDPVNLGGWHLSDEVANPARWTFPSVTLPANGYLVVFSSGKNRATAGSELHTNFSLSKGGEDLLLAQPGGSVAFQWLGFPPQIEDVSYGLASGDISPPGVFFSSPTPGWANGPGDPTVGIEPPAFSIRRGLFSSPFNLYLYPDAGLSVRYTTDSSEPTSSSGTVYTGGAISISSTTVVRAIAYNASGASRVATSSYIFPADRVYQPSSPAGYPSTWNTVTSGIDPVSADYSMDSPSKWGGASVIGNAMQELPIISLSLPVSEIFGASGFYNNGGKDNNDPFETESSFEMFYPDGRPDIQVNAGIQGRSHAANRNRKRGITVAFKSEYGTSKLDFDVFQDAPLNADSRVDSFDRLMLRSGMLDTYTGFADEKIATLTRDGVFRDAQIAVSGYGSHHTYVNLFINGMYWGQYGVAERIDPTFAKDHFGGQKSDWMVVKKEGLNTVGLDEIDGPRGQYDALVALLQNTGDNFSSSSNYNQAVALVDPSEFVDYVILAGYHGIGDWPIRNWYFVANAAKNEPGRFIGWDSEMTWAPSWHNNSGRPYYPPPLISPTHTGGGSTLVARLWRAMIKNVDFQSLFMDRTYKLMFNNGPLVPDSSLVRWNAHADRIVNSIKSEQARWSDDQVFQDYDDWLYNVDEVRARMQDMPSDFIDAFNNTQVGVKLWNDLWPPNFSSLGGTVPAGFQLVMDNQSNSSVGTIWYTVDGTDPRASRGGVVGLNGNDNKSIPISGVVTVRARVKDGSRWSAIQEATFFAPQMLDKLVINEIHYHPADAGVVGQPNFVDDKQLEFVELKNLSNDVLMLQGSSFSSGLDFTFEAGAQISPGGFVVGASNAVEFQSRYGFAPDFQYSGSSLANSGEQLVLIDPAGVVLDSLTYGDRGLWPGKPDGTGPSLSLDPSAGANNNAIYNWFASESSHGTPGEENDLVDRVVFRARVNLAGSWESGGMRTDLQSSGTIPVMSPYGTPEETDAPFLVAHPEIVDWVWYELRTSPSAASVVSRGAAFVTASGHLMDVRGGTTIEASGADTGLYHIVIGHRNHLAIISGNRFSMSNAGAVFVDFTNPTGLH